MDENCNTTVEARAPAKQEMQLHMFEEQDTHSIMGCRLPGMNLFRRNTWPVAQPVRAKCTSDHTSGGYAL